MSAAAKIFLDTNILVYTHDRTEPDKGRQARALLIGILAAGQPLLSIQVLSEFYWTVTRIITLPLSHEEAVVEVNR